jgi:hypothetical protein
MEIIFAIFALFVLVLWVIAAAYLVKFFILAMKALEKYLKSG